MPMEQMNTLGVFRASIQHQEQAVQAKVYVTSVGTGVLLSCKTAEELELISFALCVHQAAVEILLEEYNHLFQGIGCLRNKEVQLHINNTIQPVALRHRRVAFHL